MPAAFLGHGNPMNALEHNEYTEAWRHFSASCVEPRAVLMISAHWYTNVTAVTAMRSPRTIHDFYGFPQELGEFQYPAPGSVDLASEVSELAAPGRIGLDEESWGLDHGAWSVLAHAFPNADVPVIQLSINALEPFAYHVALARLLAPLRSRGVVIVGSGNLVHNLRRISWEHPTSGFDWAQRFDSRTREIMAAAPGELATLADDPDYPLAAPTPDHFIPLLYIGALAAESGCSAEVLVEGLAYGSVSMTAYALGAPSRGAAEVGSGTVPPLPDPNVTPPDQTNL
ncbi:MAG: 4,5-DOPA-extradiol-dioxygenase [Coriobacteriia bacterium]